MIAIPLAVLLFVFATFGDPEAFVRTVADGVFDVFRRFGDSLRGLL
jgi:hypothetical protein